MQITDYEKERDGFLVCMKIGTGLGAIIPQRIVKDLGLEDRSEIHVLVRGTNRKIEKRRGKFQNPNLEVGKNESNNPNDLRLLQESDKRDEGSGRDSSTD